MLRHGPPKLLRQEGAPNPGSVLRGRPGLSGGRSSASLLQEVWNGETGEIGLGFEESLLYEAVWDLCGAEVPGDDDPGCGERAEVGLAYGEGPGQGVHGGAASTHTRCGSLGDRDRRDFVAEGASVSDCGERSGAETTDLVRWG